jgi:hypothetical protein
MATMSDARYREVSARILGGDTSTAIEEPAVGGQPVDLDLVQGWRGLAEDLLADAAAHRAAIRNLIAETRASDQRFKLRVAAVRRRSAEMRAQLDALAVRR